MMGAGLQHDYSKFRASLFILNNRRRIKIEDPWSNGKQLN